MTGRGRYEPGSAGAGVRDGAVAPVRPVLSGRRGARQRMGMVVVVAVAITVLAAGIGLGGSGLDPAPSPRGASPGASGSFEPRPTGATPAATPERTAMNSSGCIPADPADLPRFRLASTHDEGVVANGMERPPQEGASGEPVATLQTSAWPVPRASSALILESSSDIVVTAVADACIRSVVAEYLAVSDLGGAPTALGPGEVNVSPRPRVVLGGVPIGDWLMRVVVAFSSGVVGSEDGVVVERFFRVTTDVNPAVSPQVTPALPCATLEPDAVASLSLRVGDGEPVTGVDLETYVGDITKTGAVVEGSALDPLILSIDGDACATSWTFQWLDPGGSRMFEVVQANRTDNPYLISQNRIVLVPDQDVFGHVAVTALVRLGIDRTVRAGWELELAGPSLPPITFSGPDGEVVDGIPGCGAGWNRPDGRSSYELCESSPIPETVRLLTLRSGDIVDIAAPGVTILHWSVVCGTRSGPNGSEFNYSGNCDLGGGMSAPMRFLPYPGRSMMQAYVGFQMEDGVEVYAPYFVEILAEP